MRETEGVEEEAVEVERVAEPGQEEEELGASFFLRAARYEDEERERDCEGASELKIARLRWRRRRRRWRRRRKPRALTLWR